MATEFFSITLVPGKAQVRIDTKVDYEFSYVLDSNTNLIHENEFYVDQGKNWFDIVRFQDIPNFAISQKVKDLFEENNITGWTCFPIIIKDYSDKSYYGFQILSKAGKILNLEKLSNYIDKYHEFDISAWNGSEIFTLEETGITACTGKVKELCENAKITNIKFDRL
jgi:hypothetical protein